MNFKHFLLMLLIGGQFMYAQEKEVALTVYNNDLALVKDSRELQLENGKQSLSFQDVAARIDPTSVRFVSLTAPDKLAVLEQNFEFDLINTQKLMQKYVDQQVTVITKENTYSGKLLSAAQSEIMLQEAGGKIRVINQSAILNLEFPQLPSGLITRPTLVWQIDSRKAGPHKTELSYLTEGISWHAEYVAVSQNEDTELELSGWVSIENRAGATFPNARLKLVAGEVNRVQEARMRPRAGYKMNAMAVEAAAPQFEEKAFFEYHLYTLQRPATVKDNQIKQISLFPTTTAKVTKLYTFDGQNFGDKVRVNLEFKNSKSAGVGMPLPAGKIRVYKADEADNSLEFIGEDKIKHTPKDEKVRVFLGNAFDIVGERKQTNRKNLGKRSREESWEIEIRNHKDQDIQVTVIEHAWGDWEIRQSTIPHAKKDANTFEFKLSVPKNSEATLNYTILTRW